MTTWVPEEAEGPSLSACASIREASRCLRSSYSIWLKPGVTSPEEQRSDKWCYTGYTEPVDKDHVYCRFSLKSVNVLVQHSIVNTTHHVWWDVDEWTGWADPGTEVELSLVSNLLVSQKCFCTDTKHILQTDTQHRELRLLIWTPKLLHAAALTTDCFITSQIFFFYRAAEFHDWPQIYQY